MDAFYSIANFTKDRRDKRGIFGDDRLVEGALFAAYVKDLRSWSRVVVKAKHEGKEVIVFLPDYGFFCTVNVKQIWDLETRFKRLPFQALTASLLIESPGLTERWSNEAVRIFKEAVCKKTLVGCVDSVSKNPDSFPQMSVGFSSLYAPLSDEKTMQPREEEMEEVVRDRKKTFSVVDLMVDKCFAKKIQSSD